MTSLRRRRKLLLLLDFDGTLHELVPDRSAVRLSPERRALLRRLMQGGRRVAIVTGRSLPDIRRLVGLRGLIYAGNSGLEIEGPGISWRHPETPALRARLEKLSAEAASAMAGEPGVEIEEKRLGLAVHERRTTPALAAKLSQLRRRTRRWGISWFRGRNAWEALPREGWGKAQAARLLWRRLGRPWLVAIGDAAADEDMFRAALGRGVGISVGRKRRSAAEFWVEDVAGVYRILGMLTARAGGGTSTRG